MHYVCTIKISVYLYTIKHEQILNTMTQQTQKIPQGAFSEMMSAVIYFDKVDEGCGYDRLNAKMQMIQMTYGLTNEDLGVVENWAHNKYYKG